MGPIQVFCKTSKLASFVMTPAALLEELLRYRTVKSTETGDFSQMSHDEICRAIQEKIDLLLNAFEKYQHISYMVQGPRDNGVDILLKGSIREDEPERYFGIQVKSYAELEDRKNDLSQKLKAGLHDARNSYGDQMERYYILLCGDARAHEKRISAITNEFAKTKLVRVIGPRHAMAFLKMQGSTVAAIVDRNLSDEDYVRKVARNEVAGYNEKKLYFVLACICEALDSANDGLSEDFFANSPRLAAMEDQFGEGSAEEFLDSCADEELESYADLFSRRIRLELFRGVRALYFDLQVRYGEDKHDLFNHLFAFLSKDAIDDAEGDE